jgi:hypothetical protein
MNVEKAVAKERQRLRLRIEQLKIVRTSMRQRAKTHAQDIMSWTTAHHAVQHLDRELAQAERRLKVLEETWV